MFRINEALARAKDLGYIDCDNDLARELWRNSTERGVYMNFLNMKNGKTKKVNIDDVPFICQTLGVSADYLFGLTESPDTSEDKENIIEKAKEIIEIITDRL